MQNKSKRSIWFTIFCLFANVILIICKTVNEDEYISMKNFQKEKLQLS